MLESRLPLGLEGDDDETDEYVDHEKSYDDNVNKIEDGDHRPVVVSRTNINFVGVNRDIQYSKFRHSLFSIIPVNMKNPLWIYDKHDVGTQKDIS